VVSEAVRQGHLSLSRQWAGIGVGKLREVGERVLALASIGQGAAEQEGRG